MNSTYLFAVHFLARPIKTSPGNACIYLRITVARKRLELSLKKKSRYAVGMSKAAASREIKKKLAQELNPYFGDIRYHIMECVRSLHFEKKRLTTHAIKRRFLGEEEADHTLCSLITYHNENMKTVLAQGTLKNYFTTERYLKLFLEKKHKVKDLLLSDLNYQFITEFEFFLRQTAPLMENNPLTNNGVMKHMERFRKMVTLAFKMEWISKDPFQRYSLKFLKVDKAFLTTSELLLVEKAELPMHKLHLARDLFVFSCYTGLAYADLMSLDSSHLCLGMEGDYWIRTSRGKTDTAVNVPLLSQAVAIVEKYKGDPRSCARGRLFPSLSNQKMNAYLKEIAAYCSITKPFSFHTARHTFATTITLSNGVPIETVSKMLGHTKLSTTQIYARVLEKKVGEDMAQLSSRLSKLP